MNPEYHMSQLEIDGVTVIPFPPEIRNEFNVIQFLLEQKEYINNTADENTEYVMGGFGAFGNPSSFHHPAIRKLRMEIYNYVLDVFKFGYPNKYIELLVDRFSQRNKNKPVTPESWHRDASIDYSKYKNNVIYGGWINLDTEQTQYFSCVPNTHLNVDTKPGFAKLSKEEADIYKQQKQLITIPPFHLVIFNELIIHEVVKRKPKLNADVFSYRLYQKYRITDRPDALFGEDKIINITQNQSPFYLHENALPPMYGKLHLVNWKDRLIEFSRNIYPIFTEKTKKDDIIVKKYMPGLKDTDLGLFPAYDQQEIVILLPNKL